MVSAELVNTLTSEQKQVFQWLNEKLELPVFAEAYLGAAQFLHDKPPGYITFVSHAGRDLMNGLAAAVLGIKREQAQYKTLTIEIHKHWPPLQTKADALKAKKAAIDREQKVEIPARAFYAVEKLVSEHVAGTERAERQNLHFFQAFFDYEGAKHMPAGFLPKWKKAREFFLEKTHLNDKGYQPEDAGKLKFHFSTLEELLLAAAKSEYERIKELNEILAETNS